MLGRTPITRSTGQMAWVLSCSNNDVPVVVGLQLVDSPGDPAFDGIPPVTTEGMLTASDAGCLSKVNEIIKQYRIRKNGRKTAPVWTMLTHEIGGHPDSCTLPPLD